MSHDIYLFGWNMSGQRVTAGVDLGSLLHHVCLGDWTHIARLGCKLLTDWVTYCPHKESWRIRGCSFQSLVSLRKEAFWLNNVAMMAVTTAKRGSGSCVYSGKRMEPSRAEGHSFLLVATMLLVVTILWWWSCLWWKNLSFFLSSFSKPPYMEKPVPFRYCTSWVILDWENLQKDLDYVLASHTVYV